MAIESSCIYPAIKCGIYPVCCVKLPQGNLSWFHVWKYASIMNLPTWAISTNPAKEKSLFGIMVWITRLPGLKLEMLINYQPCNRLKLRTTTCISTAVIDEVALGGVVSIVKQPCSVWRSPLVQHQTSSKFPMPGRFEVAFLPRTTAMDLPWLRSYSLTLPKGILSPGFQLESQPPQAPVPRCEDRTMELPVIDYHIIMWWYSGFV